MRIASDGASFCLAALLFCLSSPAARAETPPPVSAADLKPVTVGRTTVAWSGANGLSVSVDGVPVVRKSALAFTTTGTTGHTSVLLDQRRVTPRVAAWTNAPDGGQIARVTVENAAAACVYDLAVGRSGDADVVSVDLAYRLKRDGPAQLDYAPAYLSGPVLQGSVMSGPVGSPVALRIVPVAPPPRANSPEQNRLCDSFNEATLATRLGPMTISFRGDTPPPSLFDERSGARGGATSFPLFRLGIRSSVPSAAALASSERHTRFRFTFGASAAPPRTVERARLEVSRSPVLPDAYTPPPTATSPVNFQPKRAAYPSEPPFRLSPKTKIVPSDSTAGTRRAVAVLRAAIKDRTGLEPAIQLMAAPAAIFVGIAGKSLFLDRRDLGAAARAQGYSVRSSNQSVLISGFDEAGVLAGAQTTIHLLASDRQGPFIRTARIADWPTVASRTVPLITDNENRVRGGYALRLAGAGIRPVTDWLGYGPEDSPVGLPTGDSRFTDGTIYYTGNGPLLLAGRLNPPGASPVMAELPSRRESQATPRTVRLLIAASHEATEGTRIGSVHVRTSDGKTVELPLIYGKNVAAWCDARPESEAPIVWTGSTRMRQPVYLRRVEVTAAAGALIDAVTVSSANTEAAPVLFGVTFLQ